MHSFKAKIINLEWMDIKDLKKTYLDIDFYIGSIGYSMWERASMILPSFVIPITANQKHYLQVGEEIGVHKKIPENLNFSAVELINILGNIQISSKKLSFNLNGYKTICKRMKKLFATKKLTKFYEKNVSTHGPNENGAGWGSSRKHNIRLKAIISFYEKHSIIGHSLLDIDAGTVSY